MEKQTPISTEQLNFEVGFSFKHYQGYVWTITSIDGKYLNMESTHDGFTAKGTMTAKELQSVIDAGYYTPLKSCYLINSGKGVNKK